VNPGNREVLATIILSLALLHTFLAQRFRAAANRFPRGSAAENLFHLFGEIEVVFGLWAAIFAAILALLEGPKDTVRYLESLDFKEPLFVFAIMVVASTRPILWLAERLVTTCARIIPGPRSPSFYAATLVVGPLLGSVITEPAAMTVTALILKERFFSRGLPPRLAYATMGLLFVNVSIGGTLTAFAAPPVVMVASPWGWGAGTMLSLFGWKAAVAVLVGTTATTLLFLRTLRALEAAPTENPPGPPLWLTITHVAILALMVLGAHYAVVSASLLLLFLGLTSVTEMHQTPVRLREGLLVGFFLAGLVVLGTPQRWWLEPLIRSLEAGPLFLGATGLTAITDNAALTYLGAQVPNLSDALKYALVAGAVAGGGLTVVANAPNPAGYSILEDSFGEDGISAGRLFLGALGPTLLALACFWFLPSIGGG
jgi:hypothetical protein